MNNNAKYFLAILVVALLTFVGCGSRDGLQRVSVQGRVTMDHVPLKRGSIEFIPIQGTTGHKVAAEIRDGEYQLSKREGPVVGVLRVEINSIEQPSFALDDPRAHAQHVMAIAERNLVPPHYNQQSTLIRTTTADGDNEFNFNLTIGANK